jgi:3-hydroxybutyryl-CoA dehydrogenase
MKIYVIGDNNQTAVIVAKVSEKHSVLNINRLDQIEEGEEVILFDFHFNDSPDDLSIYQGMDWLNLFINTTRISLAELTFFEAETMPNIFGIAADPTFLNREVLEVSVHRKNRTEASDLLSKMGIEAAIVADRVGLVTPRIISMIINEAYFTVQEGTAKREDIDTGMKLGTNYPMGPFEWTEAWGISNIYELLEALYLDTKDERYKICPLLKQEYLELGYS